VSDLEFHKSKDYELSWVEGVIKAKNLQLDKAIIPSTAPTSLELEFSLHALDKDCKLNKHKAVFVNEPKLYDLKQTLVKKGIQAEFHEGNLVCNGVVAIRKVTTFYFK
jgi:cleavage and polyadenylation specificity factor subunit 2